MIITSRTWDLGLIYCAAVWGATFYMVKDAIAGIHPVTLVAFRFLLSAALLAPYAAVRRGGPPLLDGRLLRDSGGLAALLLALYVSQTVGLMFTSASNSGFITGLFVLFVPAILYLFKREPPMPSQSVAVVLAVAGLWLLTGGTRDVNKGDWLTLISALTYAGHLLFTDRCVRGGGDTVWLAFHQFWMTGAAALLLCVAMGYPLAIQDLGTAGVVVFLAAIPTLSAFFIQLAAQRHVQPLRVSLIFSTEPVFAALFAWTLGGEAFRALGAAGGALIVVAMAVSELSSRPSQQGAVPASEVIA